MSCNWQRIEVKTEVKSKDIFLKKQKKGNQNHDKLPCVNEMSNWLK